MSAVAAATAAPAPKLRGAFNLHETGTVPGKTEIISDDGETVYRIRDNELVAAHSPNSPEVDEDAARVQIYDDGEVIYRANPDSESDETGTDSGELMPQRRPERGVPDLDDDTIIRRDDDDDDPEVVRIPSPDQDPEVIVREEVSDDPEVVIRHEFSDDPEVVVRNDISDDPEVVIKNDVSDDPEVVVRHDVSDDPEVVVTSHGDDPEVVRRDVDPEVVRLLPIDKRMSGSDDSSEPSRMRISPRRSRREKKERPPLVNLRVPFMNCDPAIAETLWLRVLSFLMPRDLCIAALVCTEMKRLADDDEFWQPVVFKKMSYTTKPDTKTWKEVYSMRNKFVEENRIRARRENFVIVDGRVVDVVSVKSVEKGRQGLVTYVTGFDVFTDVLLEGKLGTSFVPVMLSKEECPLVSLLPDNKLKVLAANGEKTLLRPASLAPEIATNLAQGIKYAAEVISGMGRERVLRVYPRQMP